ncbi:hypothetical protein THF5H11_90101 [Vibrio jasicida]|nr:hypothetical protein THF5H11_90101 [Vibrio jasicida]
MVNSAQIKPLKVIETTLSVNLIDNGSLSLKKLTFRDAGLPINRLVADYIFYQTNCKVFITI